MVVEAFRVKKPEISYVTWSAKGIRVVYEGSMVVHLSAEDMYPLAEKTKTVSLFASERGSIVAEAV
jgi:hypothetical protein